jgi:beta-galactosidase
VARFAIGDSDFLLDGKPLQIRCGEMHFARVPREYWTHRLQAIKAMGLNTVCAYLFWNYHEWREGRSTGRPARRRRVLPPGAAGRPVGDPAPGPYACAEWEMGGLPWWLLKQPRRRLPAHPRRRLRAAGAALAGEVGRVLGPLQVTQGGPILMVQVENEYGFFGEDLDYMREMRQALLDAGFDVPLFQCNPTNAVVKTHIPGLFDGGQLRQRSGGRLQGAGQGAEGAAHVRRILFRLVRHLGRAAPARRPTAPWPTSRPC